MKKGKKVKNLLNILIAIVLLLLVYWFIKDTFFNEIEFIFKINSLELKIGDVTSIDYELSKQVNIKWESDSSVISINDGVVTARGVGSATVKGTVISGNKKITRSCYVSVYRGDKNIALNDIIINGDEIFMTLGSRYTVPISYIPSNSYISSIDYSVDDLEIVDFDGVILAKKIGTTNVTILVNKKISKIITVNVVNRKIESTLTKKINQVNLLENEIVLNRDDTWEIKYTVEPSDSFIESVKWESSNKNIVEVDNGVAKAKSPGEATISLVINNRILKKIKVIVNDSITKISLISSPKIVLKMGINDIIRTSIEPKNSSNQKLVYTSSNPNIVKIMDDGTINPIAVGNGTITVATSNGSWKEDISFTINPKFGVLNSDGGIWGYNSTRDKIPTRAEMDFFKNLSAIGKGVISNNVYIFNDGKYTYKYNINNSTLSVDNRDILMRIYYPEDVDLSSVNTFTFFGGIGERNLSGYISHLDNHRDELISSGIIILVSAKSNYYAEDGILATEFVKSIVNQKSGVKNTVGGYSMSGPQAGKAANSGMYNRLIIFNSYIYTTDANNLKNLEIVFYSPVGDSMLKSTIPALDRMADGSYNNVTVISNNKEIYGNSRYSSNFLVINPGDQMGSGHGYVNISKAKVFSYACS